MLFAGKTYRTKPLYCILNWVKYVYHIFFKSQKLLLITLTSCDLKWCCLLSVRFFLWFYKRCM